MTNYYDDGILCNNNSNNLADTMKTNTAADDSNSINTSRGVAIAWEREQGAKGTQN